MKRIIVLASLLWLSSAVLKAQCLERDSLWKRLVYLRDSSKISPGEKLNELSRYESTIRNCPYWSDSVHAFLLQRIGMAYHNLSDFMKANEYIRQSINITSSNAHKSSVKAAENIRNYFYLSAIYDSLNNMNLRMKAIDSCISIAMRLKAGSDIACLHSLYAKVEYLYDIGDYYNCIIYAQNCEKFSWEYARTYYERGKYFASSSLGWQVNALLTLKNFPAAEELLTNKVEEYKKQGLKNYLGLIYGQLAAVQMHKGNYEKALQFFNKELQYEREAGYNYNCKQTLNSIGYEIFYSHFHDADKALDSYRKALRCINKDNSLAKSDSFESLNIFVNIATACAQKGWYDSAFHYFQRAFDQIKPGIDETGILNMSFLEIKNLKKIHYISGMLIDKGDAFRKKYKDTKQGTALREATRIYKAADLLLDKIKTMQSDLQSKLFWRNDSRRLYENAIEACYLQNDAAMAFYFFEKSRASLLQDQLNEQRWLNEGDILKQNQVKKSILQVERELATTSKGSEQYRRSEDELFRYKQESDRLQQLIRINNPLYYQNFLDTNAITVKDVQQKIMKNHDALVELFAGDSAVYSLTITRDRTNFKKIDKSNFEELSNLFIRYISNPELLNKDFTGFNRLSERLYQLIFETVSLPRGRIIISPAGKYFPFEALTTNISANPSYFIDEHAVSYTYSARYLMSAFAGNTNSGSRNFMGMAPVQYASTLHLPSLWGSDKSLNRLRAHFAKADNLVNAEASKGNFLHQCYQYKVIQLYTHATDSGYNNEPMIYFADSALSLSDLVYEKKPATRLIVLAACETGIGKLYQGEGIFSFNRGFAALGIPSAISNLWQVDNESTYRLTELFYKHLANGLPVDLALQNAKNEFRLKASKENQLPYYWAAPVLAGKTDAILPEKTFVWNYIFIIVAILAACGLGWQLLMNRRRRAMQD